MKSQGPCDTTLTERFEHKACRCGTYPGNLGPCATYVEGAQPGRCVYCDHANQCHQGAAVDLRPNLTHGYSLRPSG